MAEELWVGGGSHLSAERSDPQRAHTALVAQLISALVFITPRAGGEMSVGCQARSGSPSHSWVRPTIWVRRELGAGR